MRGPRPGREISSSAAVAAAFTPFARITKFALPGAGAIAPRAPFVDDVIDALLAVGHGPPRENHPGADILRPQPAHGDGSLAPVFLAAAGDPLAVDLAGQGAQRPASATIAVSVGISAALALVKGIDTEQLDSLVADHDGVAGGGLGPAEYVVGVPGRPRRPAAGAPGHGLFGVFPRSEILPRQGALVAVVTGPGAVVMAAVAVERRIVGRSRPRRHQADQAGEEDRRSFHGAIRPYFPGIFQGVAVPRPWARAETGRRPAGRGHVGSLAFRLPARRC